MSKKIKLKPLKYVNLKAVYQMLGEYAPVSPKIFAHIIDEALDNTNQGYVHTEPRIGRKKSDDPAISNMLVGIADKLLKHNLEGKKEHPWDFYSGLDVDLVHESGDQALKDGRSVRTYVNSYFYFKEFSRPKDEHRVVFHLKYNTYQGTEWSISFPVQVVMKGFKTIPDCHYGYSHSISLLDKDGNPTDPQHHYIGITKRNWLKRMGEHFNEIRKGSNKTFHKAWRDFAGRKDVLLSSELITLNHTYDQIMDWEEWAVDAQMEAGTSLNMIPGGKKGLKFLHKHRLISDQNISLDEREKAIREYQKTNPRLGIPNLIISELWKDEEYAQRIICGAEGRLSAEQVRKIRDLNENSIPVEKITEMVGAKNRLQVERVLAGKTYSRIH
ncbi:MAG: hypothetical protein SVC26_01395 [Pseudomonadota bacterium]|nr:hypothetical protein [Pseudomonadota bacterium]